MKRVAHDPALDRLVELVATSGDPEAALGRIHDGLLARAHGGGRNVAVPSALRDTEALSRFYELLQARLRPDTRRALGQYFTPRPLVQAMWSLALDALAAAGVRRDGLRVVDPAAGSGAFLVEGLLRGLAPEQLLGVEIQPAAARTAAVNLSLAAPDRAPAQVLAADAYAEPTFDALAAHGRSGDALLVIGNPPYNGSSPLLKDAGRLASARARLLPFAKYHAPHSGFRDDFAYFVGLAHALVEACGRPAVICYVTPDSLLDARDYLGLRRFVLERYGVQVLDVGPNAFPDAKVSTAVIVCTHRGHGARHVALGEGGERRLAELAAQPALAALGAALTPAHPDHALRPAPSAELFDQGCDPVTEVLQRWFTPHKTGFDELLVDPDPERIRARLLALRDAELDPAIFGELLARPRLAAKLARVHAWARAEPAFPERERLVPYLRYNPRQARFSAPDAQWQHAYFEPRIATLFNHAWKGTVGAFRPHEAKPQLVFNTFESPLYAMVVERPGVLHLYQHARFAPLFVPEPLWRAKGLRDDLGEGAPTLNLTDAWTARAALLREPSDVFHLVAGIYQSALVQRFFAPHFGKRRPLPIRRFDATTAPIAQRIADRARALAASDPRADLPELDADVLRLYLGADLPEPKLARHPLASLP